ncbi:Protein-lysine N-methyltransferase efm4 [Microbotryomycetes sp. JL201]|nr:Protein-lysine N-methyltransferase efm4 [Microbotryomycetes sp. JL201]
MVSLKEAMDQLAASGDAPELSSLQPSRLGSKAHWDSVRLKPLCEWITNPNRNVYEREVKTFDEIGDEGEVWFGEESADKMVEWIEEHMSDHATGILDVGTGNGQLLFALAEAGYSDLTGVDYSAPSTILAQNIARSRKLESSPTFVTGDILDSSATISGVTDRQWKLITDKGTMDAICLSDEERDGQRIGQLYPAAISRLLEVGGIFLITSCNFTRAELEKAFVTDSTGFDFHSHVPRPTFAFGGSTGSSITTVAFERKR